MATLQDRLNELPPHLRREVEGFVEFLVAKRGRKLGHRLKLDWAAALKDYRDR